MARKKDASYIDEATLRQAQGDLERIPQGKISLRLLAVISAGRGKTILETSDFLMVTRQSVYFWIKRYKKQGLDGLYDRPKGHPARRLSPEQERQIKKWLDQNQGPEGETFHWTIDKLKAAIAEEFGVVLSRSWVAVLLKQWGFRSKVPRPRHAESDQARQQAFKKNSRNR
jgi:putative transposase